jgi:Holliday junction resolvase RusA-like endonuclease
MGIGYRNSGGRISRDWVRGVVISQEASARTSPVSETAYEPDVSLPFPIEFMIRDTPRSHQSPNSKGKESWKLRVRDVANAHVRTLRDFYYIDYRPLAATIFYFPPGEMEGDVDNIVKLIVDGMATVLYPDDRLLEVITHLG